MIAKRKLIELQQNFKYRAGADMVCVKFSCAFNDTRCIYYMI